MVTVIYLCTLYDLVPVCATYWEACHEYFLYIICCSIVAILVDLNSQQWIHTSLFELVMTCIKAHIFVYSFSISHIFIFIIKLFRFS